MPTLSFTPNLQRHVQSPAADLAGDTVGAVLEAYCRHNPVVRGYVLDDQGALRKHVAVFVNGALVADRLRLSDPVHRGDAIFIAQALSGG